MKVLKSLVAPALLAALLAGCGGSSRVSHYVPDRMVAFGDELSLIQADGSKPAVNALKVNTTELDCAVYPMWQQRVASQYGMVFPQCNPSGVANPQATMRAASGARVADVEAAVQAHRAASAFEPRTLVTISAGLNDIAAAYAAFDAGTLTREQALAQVADAGRRLGMLVDSIVDGGRGARVIYMWPPDLGDAPYAASEVTRTGQEARRTLLHDLTQAFIDALRPANEGLHVGRVDAALRIRTALTPTSLAGLALTNGTEPACTVTLQTPCTTGTLVAGAAANGMNYLWADLQHPGPRFHDWIGERAFNHSYNVLLPLD